MGGFGNVMFQLLVYNKLKREKENVFLVNSLTKRNILTKLLGWTIHQTLYNDLVEQKTIINVNSMYCFFIVFIAFLSKKFRIKFRLATFYSEDLQLEKNLSKNIFGYFQNKKFLSSNIKNILIMGDKINKKYCSKNDKTVIHFRMGDTDWGRRFYHYYEKVKNHVKNEEKPVLIVTDSYKEAITFFNNFKNIKIIKSRNALDDFKLLVSAQKLYCAPSTFSWWAAHSTSIETEIIMPKFFDENLGIYMKNKNIQLI